MEHARPPSELSLEGGPAARADAWRKWYKQFNVFMKASGACKEPKDVQASLLVNLIGPDGYDIYSTFKFIKEEDRDDDLDGVDSFVDDVIVWGTTKEEHDARLKRLLDRAREVGIRFNKSKCEFCVEKITYLGHTFSAEGMQIDTDKLKAITDMPEPNDRTSLERFLGMVNYLSKFISGYSETAAPLRSLLKKDVCWVWEAAHSAAVAALKAALVAAPVLALYDAAAPVLLSVDASSQALGAVLLQGGRPVEFASLTLTDTQSRYAQIEKELLAIVFALERFHQYVFGRGDVTVETDHKPLEALFDKPLDAVPTRLQRMMLRIQGYSFKVTYKPGKYMYIADTLSRAALPELMEDNVTAEVEDQVCFVIDNVRFSDDRLREIKRATRDNDVCQVLINYILKGWPVNKYDCAVELRALWSHRESLEYIDEVILKDKLVYIPEELRGEMVARVHAGHLGIDRCKRRARDVMWWPGMSRAVEAAVRACRACAEHAARPAREPMIPHQVPPLPWMKLGTDLFEVGKKYFLIVVDYFSNFIEVSPLTNIGSKAVIAALKDQFARHGIPSELISDNGPAYSSHEFRAFCQEWGVTHVTTSPNYAQANGLSERAVRTVKGIIKKSLTSGADLYLGLLNFRATPRHGISSPSQLLMGRRLNTRLPVHIDRLRPDRNNDNDFTNIIKNREYSKRHYDAHSRELPPLREGEEVIVVEGAGAQGGRRRMRVAGRAPHSQPRSYFLTDDTGRQYRRNRRHLIKTYSNEDTHRSPPASPGGKEDGDSSGDSVYGDVVSDEDAPGGARAQGLVGGGRGGGPAQGPAGGRGGDAPVHRQAAEQAREKLASLFYKRNNK
ncbi:unnamed protein product [Plutella xylostella]|uniref:RNA-directed DNA polymerase n=1 Tax=Plutella xylostella TaxID=51655 RepID=A0A8S4D1C2_PLUXY|nr:unnamed protein product [Plutella xylostella]